MANTGRTTSKWSNFIVGDISDVLRSIPMFTFTGAGIKFANKDVTALQDQVKGMLAEMPEVQIEVTGPFDTSAAVAVGALSGSHTVLAPLLGVQTPRSFDFQMGIQHAWVTGEPQFGISKSATSGIWLAEYEFDSAEYRALFLMYGGSALPAFGTTAEV